MKKTSSSNKAHLFFFYTQQMERFRVVEKETKTKAYSKEGETFIKY